MKRVLSAILAGLVLVGSAPEAAAQVATTTPPATPAPREALAAPSSSAPAFRTERNSLPLLFTGIGLAVIGLGGLGGGYAGTLVGRRDCDDSAASQPASVYEAVYSHCTTKSDAIAGGTAAMIAGGAFTVLGTAFIVAGAWKVTVPNTAASRLVPNVDVGTSSLRLRWTF